MNWSKEQNEIFSWFSEGYGNLIVRARAGTGKTTTILQAVSSAKETNNGGNVLIAAFNRVIADEIVAKLAKIGAKSNVSAMTLHGAGYKVVRSRTRYVKVDATRGGTIASEVCGSNFPNEIVTIVKNIVDKVKEISPLDHSDRVIEDLAWKFDLVPDIEYEREGIKLETLFPFVRKALDRALERDTNPSIDFADMLYIPIAADIIRPEYDLIVIDEAQDMSPAQLILAQRLCNPEGRIAVVGDDRQAIYGFRGADSGSIDRLKTELNATELGLTCTYRCGSKIVEMAAQLVPDYKAALNNPEGQILATIPSKMLESVIPGDFILSRKNAPLASYCMQLLKANKRAKIRGRDIGNSLISLVKKMKAKSIPSFLEKLQAWKEKEIVRVSKKAKTPEQAEEKIRVIEDQADTLASLTEGLTGPQELIARIESLFTDDPSADAFILLSSVHKAKGLESSNVYLIEDSFTMKGKRIDRKEEDNIRYVAITRAKDRLYLVSEPKASE